MVFGVPATFNLLLDRTASVSSSIAAAAGAGAGPLAGVRYCFSAAAPLPIHVETAWRDRFGLAIYQGYGLTETSPFASYNHVTEHRPGSIGMAIDRVEMRVVDVRTRQPLPTGERGEIVIRGPNVMLGYWNRPAETAEVMQDGWFHTGDIGRTDADGYFYIEDRIKDMVIIGGSNVYPAEIEHVLSQHPAVADAAVFGVPAPVLGERVWAAVVLGPDATVTEGEIIAFCRSRMAHFKVPARVEFVEELPRNRTGKVLKRVLRQRHGAAGPITPSAASGMHRDEFNTPVTPDAETIQVWLLRWLGETLHAERPLDPERPLAEEGVTSVAGVELASALERWLGRPVPPTIAWQYPTVNAIARHLAHGAVGQSGAIAAQQAIDALAAQDAFIDLSSVENLSEADAEAALVEELRRLQG
jgi:long-chain acyl-CoA synthetase